MLKRALVHMMSAFLTPLVLVLSAKTVPCTQLACIVSDEPCTTHFCYLSYCFLLLSKVAH